MKVEIEKAYTNWRVKEKFKTSPEYQIRMNPPSSPELIIETVGLDVDYCARQVILKLKQLGLIGSQSQGI